MTNHSVLNAQIPSKIAILPIGPFRVTDLVDNPPANLGRTFRNDVVVYKKYPNIKRVGADNQSVIYEKI